jgi:hypothetical protein
MNLHEGLIMTMVLAAATDRNLSRAEQKRLRDLVAHLPVFTDFEPKNLARVCESCAATLAGDNGIDRAARLIKKAVPKRFGPTAYTIACDMLAADGRIGDIEVGLLDMLADLFSIDSLSCAAIEMASRARYATPA